MKPWMVLGTMAALLTLTSCQKVAERVGEIITGADAHSASEFQPESDVPVPALCGLEKTGYSQHFTPIAGSFADNVLAVPPGANALRLDGAFLAFKEQTKWRPTLTLSLTTGAKSQYKLRYLKNPGDTLLRVETETDDGKNFNEFEHDFYAHPGLLAPLRADISWTADGTITTAIYNSPQGFSGPAETHVYKGGPVTAVDALVSSADADVHSLAFGHVCQPNELTEVAADASDSGSSQ